MQKLSNTLTRWHKIAERITSRMKAIQSEISRSIAYSGDVSIIEVLHLDLVKTAKVAVSDKASMYQELNNALVLIKASIAKSNASAGVSSFLVEIEGARRQIQFLESLVNSLQSAVHVENCLELAAKANPDDSRSHMLRSHFTVRLINDDEFTTLKQNLANETRRMEGLTDKLADANASKVVIELSDSVCAELGLI